MSKDKWFDIVKDHISSDLVERRGQKGVKIITKNILCRIRDNRYLFEDNIYGASEDFYTTIDALCKSKYVSKKIINEKSYYQISFFRAMLNRKWHLLFPRAIKIECVKQ